MKTVLFVGAMVAAWAVFFAAALFLGGWSGRDSFVFANVASAAFNVAVMFAVMGGVIKP